MEKRDVSSAKSLAVVHSWSHRSLISIDINCDPSIEPWGTPASILIQEETCIFKTTACVLSYKYKDR